MTDKFEQRDMTGSLFPPRNEQIVGQGPAKLFDNEANCYLIESNWTTSDGQQRTSQKLAVVIGEYAPNKQKRNENDSDYYVNGIIGDIPVMCWGRNKVSQKARLTPRFLLKKRTAKPVRMMTTTSRYKNAKHLAYVRSLPCLVGPHGCAGDVEAHHLMKPWFGYRGMGMKAEDMNCIPLCHGHHMLLHELTEYKFLNGEDCHILMGKCKLRKYGYNHRIGS